MLRQSVIRNLKFSKTEIHQAIVRLKTFGSFQDFHMAGRPKVTSQRDDYMIKRMVVCSSTTSSKKIRLGLLLTGTVVSTSTIKRGLSDEFGIRGYKPTRKPRSTLFMKAKRYAFAKDHLDWTAVNGGRYYFPTNQLFNNLHRESISLESQLVPDMHIVTQSRPWNPPKHHGLGSNVCKWYSWSVFPPGRFYHEWYQISRSPQGK